MTEATVVIARVGPAPHKPFTCPTCDRQELHHLPGANQADDPWCSECNNPWPCGGYLAETGQA